MAKINLDKMTELNETLVGLKKIESDSKVRDFFGHKIRQIIDGIEKVEHLVEQLLTQGTIKWESKQERTLHKINDSLESMVVKLTKTANDYSKNRGKAIEEGFSNLDAQYKHFADGLTQTFKVIKEICEELKRKQDKVDIKEVDETEKRLDQVLDICSREVKHPGEQVEQEKVKEEKKEHKEPEFQLKRKPLEKKEVVVPNKKSFERTTELNADKKKVKQEITTQKNEIMRLSDQIRNSKQIKNEDKLRWDSNLSFLNDVIKNIEDENFQVHQLLTVKETLIEMNLIAGSKRSPVVTSLDSMIEKYVL
jgi:hypothetical protein